MQLLGFTSFNKGVHLKQTSTITSPPIAFKKLLYFFALSRTHHGFLDMMSPTFAALLFLGKFPQINIIVAGIITVFSGYTAVYALNDIAGLKDDKKNIQQKNSKIELLRCGFSPYPASFGTGKARIDSGNAV